MDNTTYIFLSLLSLAAIMVFWFFLRKRAPKPISKLAAFAFLFVLIGITFGDNRVIGYGMIAVGLVLAVIDIAREIKSRE